MQHTICITEQQGISMSDRKNTSIAANFSTDAEAHSDKLTSTVVPSDAAANDANGWQQYREWISKAPAPRSRRAGIDPALYTWKGYRNWSEQVKRDWSPDQADDSE
jgi:hypothetical protein